MNARADVDWLDSPRALEASAERLRIVKAPGMDVGLDCHGRLHKPMAKQLATVLGTHRPLFIEEPLLSEHAKSHSKLTSCPIALSERFYIRWDAKRFLEDASVEPDISHCCSISEIRKIAAIAEAYDVALAPHCPLGPIALAACMPVAMSTPNFLIQGISVSIQYNTESGENDIHSYFHDKSVRNVTDGYIAGLKEPGLVIEIDEDEVRKVAAIAIAWQPKGFKGPDGSIREW